MGLTAINHSSKVALFSGDGRCGARMMSDIKKQCSPCVIRLLENGLGILYWSSVDSRIVMSFELWSLNVVKG
jgi:hypothetical protein